MKTKTVARSMDTGTVPLENLIQLDGWDKLEASEQDTVRTETLQAADALYNLGKAKLAVGEHLYNVQQILEPRRIFTKYLLSLFHISRATAYRYIDLYKETREILPTPIFKAAMLRADDRLNLRLVKQTPPPRTTNIVKINEYLDSVQRGQERAVGVTRTNEDIERMLFRHMTSLLHGLPLRARNTVLSHVVGAILTEWGLTQPMTVKPSPIPSFFRATRGRPVKAA